MGIFCYYENSPPLFLQGPSGREYLPKTALPLNFRSTPSNIYVHLWHLIILENNLRLNPMENFGGGHECVL